MKQTGNPPSNRYQADSAVNKSQTADTVGVLMAFVIAFGFPFYALYDLLKRGYRTLADES